MAEQKSYYAIIPAGVRYDCGLPANAKLLYGEITALCSTEGYCWAGNDYFAKLYGVTKRSIERWINALSDKGYISIELTYKENGKEIDKRCISIVDACTSRDAIETPHDKNVGTDKNVVPPRQNCRTPHDKNVADNNTSINNTLNIQKEIDKEKAGRTFQKPTLEEVQAYCIERKNNVDAQRFIDHYTSNGWKVGKVPMKDWKAAVRNWEKNNLSSAKGRTTPEKGDERYDFAALRRQEIERVKGYIEAKKEGVT